MSEQPANDKSGPHSAKPTDRFPQKVSEQPWKVSEELFDPDVGHGGMFIACAVGGLLEEDDLLVDLEAAIAI